MTTMCLHCGQPILNYTEALLTPDLWLHVATGDRWCNSELAGYLATPDPYYEKDN